MKKKKKFILGMTVVALASITVILQSSFNSNPNVQSNKEIVFYDSEMAMQTDEFKESMINQLNEEYGDDYASIISLNSQAVETSAEVNDLIINDNGVYPDYYGGMYINNEQKLVVQIVSNNIPTITNSAYQTYDSLAAIDDNIVIDYVDNSYNELKEIDDSIINYFANNLSSDISIVGNYVDVYTNKVVVELEDNTPAEQQKFKDLVFDSEHIIFKTGERSSNALNAGQGLYNGNQLLCSLGFRAKRNGQNGFVTAGHCVESFAEGNSYYSYGTLRKKVYSNGKKADAAFIQSSATITNNLQYSISSYPPVNSLSTMTYPSVNITAGMAVGKSGAVSQGTYGTVTAASYTVYSFNDVTGDTIQLPDQVKTNVYALDGDSGGVVVNISLNRDPVAIGIVQGSTNQTHEMNFSKYSNIASLLGITTY